MSIHPLHYVELKRLQPERTERRSLSIRICVLIEVRLDSHSRPATEYCHRNSSTSMSTSTLILNPFAGHTAYHKGVRSRGCTVAWYVLTVTVCYLQVHSFFKSDPGSRLTQLNLLNNAVAATTTGPTVGVHRFI